MPHRALPGPAAGLLLALAIAAAIPAVSAHAQARGDGFLFRVPEGAVTFLAGYSVPSASGGVFADTRQLLTLEENDFNSFMAGVEYSRVIAERLEVFGSVVYTSASRKSEFRDWVDENNLPIEQTTSFARFPIAAGIRLALLPPGRSVGSFAWLPTLVVPHLSAGGGIMWYSFRQSGDFVDFMDNEIITDNLASSGWAPFAHTAAGLDLTISTTTALLAEVRYNVARGKMGGDFEGYDRIDLSGFSSTIGLRIRY